MNTGILPIRPLQHRTQGWKRPVDYHFAAADAVVAVCLQELPALLPYYPLAIVRSPDGKPHLVALLSPLPHANLFVDAAGRWLAPYIPSHYRAYPFAVVKAKDAPQADQQPLVLCFNHDSGLFRERPELDAGERRFFDDQGEPQPLTQNLVEFLKATYIARHQTDQAVAALDRAGLLTPWVLPLDEPVDAKPTGLRGLLRINEPALNALDAGALKTLQQHNGLAIAYAQLFSMPRIAALQALHPRIAQGVSAPAELDFELLFGSDGDMIKFANLIS